MVEREMESPAVAVYRDARTRFIELVRSLDEDTLSLSVPACPDWTAQQVVAHLVGASADFVVANFPGATVDFESWTAVQVAVRHDRSLEELLIEWDELLPAVVERLADGRIPAGPLINDTVVHEQDIRGTAGVPGGRDTAAYTYFRERFVAGLGYRIQQAGVGALALRTELGEHVAGDGQPAVAVSASDFELFRALAGRRSVAQIARFRWDGDSTPYLRLIPTFGPPSHDIVERS